MRRQSQPPSMGSWVGVLKGRAPGRGGPARLRRRGSRVTRGAHVRGRHERAPRGPFLRPRRAGSLPDHHLLLARAHRWRRPACRRRCWRAGMLLGAPMAREERRACGSVLRRSFEFLRRVEHAAPDLGEIEKKRWSLAVPSIFLAGFRGVLLQRHLQRVVEATLRPPRSAMFSPSVSCPFTCRPSIAT